MQPTFSFFEALNASLNRMGFDLNNEIKIGDFITILTILISLTSLMIALKKDRDLRQRAQADIVRSSVAKTLAKLDRWREISLSMFDRMDIIFVNASKFWAQNEKGEVLKDMLWQDIDILRVETLRSITDEEIETAYTDLYGFDPYARAYFENILDLLKEEEEIMYRKALQPGIQEKVNEMEDNKMRRSTGEFRNALANRAKGIRGEYESRLNIILRKVSDSLLKLIKEKDNTILSISKRSYFDHLSLDIDPVLTDNYGIMTKDNTAIIFPK